MKNHVLNNNNLKNVLFIINLEYYFNSNQGQDGDMFNKNLNLEVKKEYQLNSKR